MHGAGQAVHEDRFGEFARRGLAEADDGVQLVVANENIIEPVPVQIDDIDMGNPRLPLEAIPTGLGKSSR